MPRHSYKTPFIIQPPADLVKKHPQLHHLGSQLALKYASKQVVTEDNLATVGRKLWEALDIADGFEQAYAKSGTAIFPIIIESDSSEIQALPWETLHHPKYGFLGKDARFTLTRRLFSNSPTPPPLEKGPLRILLFTSLPDDLHPETSRLNVEEEQASVQEALLPFIAQGLVDLEMPDDGRFSTLKELLKRFQPHLLFLSGHGRFYNQKHAEKSYGEFVFESETGKSNPIRDAEIAKVFVGSSVQGVVLSACESGKAASDALNNGLMQKLSAQGIPHVIGMRESIYDNAGIQFAHAICKEFAQAERADVSLQTAREAIQRPFAGISRREAQAALAAELSFGQWALPMLLSPVPERPLIDWDFAPQEKEELVSKSLNMITLPPRFIGRRKEMRKYKSQLFDGSLKNLLITGEGGQGKTTLAGKLATDLQSYGSYKVFAWSAQLKQTWRDFEFGLELSLNTERGQKYDRFRGRFEKESERIAFLLSLLNEEFQGKLLFFFDNLESLQDPQSLKLEDATLADWIELLLADKKSILLATSRWALPNWRGELLPLNHANYGDFLQMAQGLALSKKLPTRFLNREKLRLIYEVLGGNGRGLNLFGAAAQSIKDEAKEEAFITALADSQADIQADMAIDEIYSHLSEEAKVLLSRLPAYQQAVPIEGIIKLFTFSEDPKGFKDATVKSESMSSKPSDEKEVSKKPFGSLTKKMLARLVAVSLVEAQEEAEWDVLQYQLSPLVAEWLQKKNLVDTALRWRSLAADYQFYLYRQERRNLNQAMIVHAALQRAERKDEADRLALDRIVGPLNRAGLYQTILKTWLPEIAKSGAKKTRAEALGQIGKQHHHLGDYATALDYLKKSLSIREEIGDNKGESVTLNNISNIYQAQGDYKTSLEYSKRDLAICKKIGDKAGLCVTLFNMGHKYAQKDEIQEAVGMWVEAYLISKEINYAEILQALAQLAPQLGLPEGLKGWDGLAQKMQAGNTEQEDQSDALRQFIQTVVLAAKEKSPEAKEYFERVSKLARDENAPPEYREVGKVLQKVLMGDKSPDLSALPSELSEMVREVLS